MDYAGHCVGIDAMRAGRVALHDLDEVTRSRHREPQHVRVSVVPVGRIAHADAGTRCGEVQRAFGGQTENLCGAQD